MADASLARVRWRLRGAWMWPTFVVLTAVDGTLWQKRPLLGDSMSSPGTYILAFIANLVAIVLPGPALGMLVRRRRPDMPRLVARDYGGTSAVCLVTVLGLVVGLIHEQTVRSDRAALRQASSIAEAYIGSKAPSQYLHDLDQLDVYEVQPPRIYRICADDVSGTRWYCVAVTLPADGRTATGPGSFDGAYVKPDGSESNQLLSEGTN